MAKQKQPTKKKVFPARRKRSNKFWDVWNEMGDSLDAMGADAQNLV